jgi:thiol-disulfide isomerase/thioredoxin
MKTILTTTALATLLLSAGPALAADTGAAATPVDGRWDAVLTDNGPDIPFRLDISGSGQTLKGTFYDGLRPYDGTTNASFQDGKLTLEAEHYLTAIHATLVNGALVGDTTLQGPGYGIKYGFRAVRHVDAPAAAASAGVPAIAGSWVVPLSSPSSKGEKAFRLVVRQNGGEAEASILRIDGDTGAYSGTFKDGKWLLGHFDGSRPGVIEVSANADGTLTVVAHNEALAHALAGNDSKGYSEGGYDATPHYTAYRPDVALAKGLPRPDDFNTHTTASDPNAIFRFNFPDSDGHLVSQDDPRFKGKVVLAVVTGTWCPNCHDEAQYLVQLDKKYRDKGLAIVALNFEEPEQQDTLKRQRAFVKQYGVKYTYLLAGSPAQMWEKVPQLNHLDTWPATVFIGRDGKVKAVHSGFASPASGEFHAQLEQDFTNRIEQLLAEKPVVAQADTAATPVRTALK